ncbi:MAG: efflux RND transporter periplasmic adaptor subunit [Massilia sp.]|nr:efflux RND transporter periplasmic adaptor subunit [Massilia sp.]
MSRILIRRSLVALAVLGAVATAIWWANRPKPIAVVLQTIDRGKVELTVANTRAGEVKACMRTRLSTILGGRIEVMAVKEGDHVKKGQLLIKLWNDDQKAQYALAQTQVESARKHVTEACVLAANATRDAERQAALRAQGFISSAAEEQARAAAESKRASCEAVKADVVQANARVAAIRVEQSRTVLYAPFDGIVAKIVGEVGEYSTPSPPGVPTPPAIDLIDNSCLYVSAPLDEVDAPKIRAGQVVRISLDAFPKQSFSGKVRRVAPYVSALEKQARTVDLEATFDQAAPAGKLLVGYSANVEVILAVRENVVRVPTSALQEGARVLVAGADGTLQARALKTGVANWEYTEVLSGLAPGERVVTSPEREGVRAGASYAAEAKPSP